MKMGKQGVVNQRERAKGLKTEGLREIGKVTQKHGYFTFSQRRKCNIVSTNTFTNCSHEENHEECFVNLFKIKY